MNKNIKNRKALIEAGERLSLVLHDTERYFNENVRHVDDFKVILTFLRCWHKWVDLLRYVSICDEVTCNKDPDNGHYILYLIEKIDIMQATESTHDIADVIYAEWPEIAKMFRINIDVTNESILWRAFNVTELNSKECVDQIAKLKDTMMISEHKYAEEYESRYDIPDIDWPGIIQDGKTYFADGESLEGKPLCVLCMIASARMSRLYVELINKAYPLAHSTMAFDDYQMRFDHNSKHVQSAFDREICHE